MKIDEFIVILEANALEITESQGGYPAIWAMVGEHVVHAFTHDGDNEPELAVYTNKQILAWIQEFEKLKASGEFEDGDWEILEESCPNHDNY